MLAHPRRIEELFQRVLGASFVPREKFHQVHDNHGFTLIERLADGVQLRLILRVPVRAVLSYTRMHSDDPLTSYFVESRLLKKES